MFDNTILWKTFRSKKEEISGGWRKVLNEELRNLYFSQNILGMMEFRMASLEGGALRM
jgi:hypothetical protein